MAHAAHPQKSEKPIPPAPSPDSENEALLDAKKTFVWAMLSAVAFIGAATGIILMTRLG